MADSTPNEKLVSNSAVMDAGADSVGEQRSDSDGVEFFRCWDCYECRKGHGLGRLPIVYSREESKRFPFYGTTFALECECSYTNYPFAGAVEFLEQMRSSGRDYVIQRRTR